MQRQHATISQLTRRFGVSPRTLRYYEQVGLIESIRPEGYAYRCYDERNAARVAQIVLLRKLRIPIGQIAELLQSDEASSAIELFQRHIANMSEEIDALGTLRSILSELIGRLQSVQPLRLSEKLLEDASIRALIAAAPGEPTMTRKPKEVYTMEELNRANARIDRLQNVRIVHLPPATVAASHFIGDEPERVAGERLFAFARAADIAKIKPDVRLFGFNHPNPIDETDAHGYEFWMTIPDDLPVPEPLTRKRFEGGLYAAHAIRMGDFHEWARLDEWVQTNGEYVYRGSGSPENMFGALEEQLNAFTQLKEGTLDPKQLDLLIPVRRA